MAIGDPYVTPEEIAGHCGVPNPGDGTFEALALAASQAVELFTCRQFNRDEVASPRRFRAVDYERVKTDDFWTMDDFAISVDGTEWATEDVDPRPWDGIHCGQPGWPFFDLFAVNRCFGWKARRRIALVTVTAKWGWEEVPPLIKLAVLDVACDLRSGLVSEVRSEQAGGLSISYGQLQVDPDDLRGVVAGNPSAYVRASPYVVDSPMGVA